MEGGNSGKDWPRRDNGGREREGDTDYSGEW